MVAHGSLKKPAVVLALALGSWQAIAWLAALHSLESRVRPIERALARLETEMAADTLWLEGESRLQAGYGRTREYAARLAVNARRERAHGLLLEIYRERLASPAPPLLFLPLPGPSWPSTGAPTPPPKP